MSYVALVTERYDMVVEFYGQRLGSGNGGYGVYCCIGLEETTGLPNRSADRTVAMPGISAMSGRLAHNGRVSPLFIG